uniref:Cytochrome b5 heme-binding domain-containing protein n=1 Tax=Alexandrium andersonii TaxID=327968 RepID=A0A7S2C6I5_9DINO
MRYRTRGHLGQQVFRRPAGVDVTRLTTLRRAAALCGHGPLLDLVEETMEKLKPKNVAKVPWEEVCQHTSKDDLWLLIDGRVYDVTPFLDIHPGGGQLILDAAGKESTALFELTHGEGLRYSLRLLNQFFIGVCEGKEKAPLAVKDPPTPEFLETLRSITGALHTFDEAKATGEAQGILR